MIVLDRYDKSPKRWADASNNTIDAVNHTAKAKLTIAHTGIKYTTSDPKLPFTLIQSSSNFARPCSFTTRIFDGKQRATYAINGEATMNNTALMISAKSPTAIDI